MEIGTGIFLGMTFLGIVALYIVTRDRWKWKKITIRAIVICCILPLIAWGGIAVIDAYKNRIVPVHAYQ